MYICAGDIAGPTKPANSLRMKTKTGKLLDIQLQLTQLIMAVEHGQMDNKQAAEKLTRINQGIAGIIQYLREHEKEGGRGGSA